MYKTKILSNQEGSRDLEEKAKVKGGKETMLFCVFDQTCRLSFLSLITGNISVFREERLLTKG